jgi:Streptogramin lyase
MPTLGQRSRDPIQAADGSIWWAGQFGNLIGRLNPATGEMKEYKLPPNALPHSVWLDDKGIPWYSGNKNGTVGKVDPATGKVTEYKMPDPAAKDPHTAVFDKKGILWFTLQNSNMVGRLDPATGDIKLVTMSTPDSKPYGIKIDAEGVPWFACNGRPCLVKIDPATMALTEVALPFAGTTVRRLDIADDGMIWYVNSGRGQLGATIRRPARSRSGSHPAGRSRIPTPSWWSTASSGTTSPASARMPWSVSIPARRRSRAGRFRRAASMPASSGTCARPARATCSFTRAAPTGSSS